MKFRNRKLQLQKAKNSFSTHSFTNMLIKTYHPSGVHCFANDSILYGRIEEKIRDLYNIQGLVTLFYRDNQDDWVHLSSDDDVSFALSTLNFQILHIKVVTNPSETGKFIKMLTFPQN